MNAGYIKLFETGIGVELAKSLRRPAHRLAYLILSRRGIPAIEATCWELDPLLLAIPKISRNYAIQACGALVGELIIEDGATRAKTRSGLPRSARVKGSHIINRAAVWNVDNVDIARLMKHAK